MKIAANQAADDAFQTQQELKQRERARIRKTVSIVISQTVLDSLPVANDVQLFADNHSS